MVLYAVLKPGMYAEDMYIQEFTLGSIIEKNAS